MECNLLNIEAPIGKICPSVYNLDKDICCEDCGFSEKTWKEIGMTK